ncbi:MAG: adenylyl-sulfate kinase [Candidatus Caldatribacteriota bacterium]|nr:adenylyl-sulfate kinase [Candidatus Caldatribacteriota bacterium]
MIVALLGKAGSGKTYIAEKMEKIVPNSFIIDGDDLRAETSNTDVSLTGREHNIHLGYKRARWLSDLGFTVFVAMQAPIKEIRDKYLTKNDIEIEVINTGKNPKEKYNINFIADYTDTLKFEFIYNKFKPKKFFKKFFPKVLVIARFQGMHRGHQIVLREAERLSPNVTIGLRVDEGDQLDLEKNINLLKAKGYKVEKTPNLKDSNKDWIDYVDNYDIVVQGNPEVIERFNGAKVNLHYVPRIGHISATKIRNAIKNDDIEYAEQYVDSDVIEFLKDEIC